jgi:hypothetical protein
VSCGILAGHRLDHYLKLELGQPLEERSEALAVGAIGRRFGFGFYHKL